VSTSPITRRQALRLALTGSVALAGIGVALSGPAASTILAGQASASVRLLGAQAGPLPTTTDVPEVARTETGSAGNRATGSVAVPVRVQSLDLATGQLQPLATPQALPDGTPILQSGEALTGITTLVNGTIVLAITPESGAKNETSPTRLILLGSPPVALNVSGLNRDQQLGDVVGTSDGRLVGLVMKRNGTPPVTLVNVDLGTGATSAITRIALPPSRRFRTLTQCPDGSLYTVAVENNGDVILVRLDLAQNRPIDVARLTSDGEPWDNGLESLMCTGASQPQLLALGARRYVTPNSVYSIDMSTGVMTKLRDFDTAKATLSRT
jgi:hypothetical protein